MSTNATKSKCTTPFTIGKLDITIGQRTSLFVFNLVILLINIMANGAAILALLKSQPVRRRPAIVLILYLCWCDLSYALISQTLFSIKMFNPELPCIYDLTFEFSSSVLGNLSLCIVVLISLSRYLHTHYMMQVRLFITKTRVRIAVSCSFLLAILLSSVAAVGSSYGDISVYIQTQAFVTALGVALILFVVAIYHKTEAIARKRKAASQYAMGYTCYSEKVLKKIMLSTLATLLPLRVPFFASTVFKSVTKEIYKEPLTWWMQYMHLASYEILCLSAGANALIFLYNNSMARKFIAGTTIRWLTYLGCPGKVSGTVVEPIADDILANGLATPMVTTGWYDRYAPTAAPKTLSSTVVGKKVISGNVRGKRSKESKRRLRRKKQQKELGSVGEPNKTTNCGDTAEKRYPSKKRFWQKKWRIQWKKKERSGGEVDNNIPKTCECKNDPEEKRNLRVILNLGFPRSSRIGYIFPKDEQTLSYDCAGPSGYNVQCS